MDHFTQLANLALLPLLLMTITMNIIHKVLLVFDNSSSITTSVVFSQS